MQAVEYPGRSEPEDHPATAAVDPERSLTEDAVGYRPFYFRVERKTHK